MDGAAALSPGGGSLRFGPREQAAIAIVAALAGALLLISDSYVLSLPCPFHTFFGVLCPGCGGTRAVRALLRLQWAEAVTYNPLIVALAPAAALSAGWQAISALRWNRWRPVPFASGVAKALLGVATAFTIARNYEAVLR